MKQQAALAAVVIGLAACGLRAQAQPVLDGNAGPGDGYVSLSIQNTQTDFGDNNSADPIATANGGSELDQIFGQIKNNRLYMVFAGNLETNFNKLEVFIDSDSGAPSPGGVNIIDGASLPVEVDAFCCGGFGSGVGALQQVGVDGLAFDEGFTADYYLTFSNGRENVGEEGNDRIEFWAINAHYADLTQGTDGDVVSAGIQLAHRGLPQVLRSPLQSDFNDSTTVDSADYIILQRGTNQFDGTTTFATKQDGDANDDDLVDGDDVVEFESQFNTHPGLTDFPFFPSADGISSDDLLGPALPGLAQGQLIDKNYALGPGGATNNSGAGLIAPEVEFVLPVDTVNDPDNDRNHRNFENTVGIELAFDNSNVDGVEGGSGQTTGNPQDVTTGLEFSIPLSAIGNPTGDILVTAFINGGLHDFSSNQYSGDGVLQGNFGTLPPDLANELDGPGTQFVTISQSAVSGVPEPTALLLLATAGCTGVLRRRR